MELVEKIVKESVGAVMGQTIREDYIIDRRSVQYPRSCLELSVNILLTFWHYSLPNILINCFCKKKSLTLDVTIFQTCLSD